MTEAHDSTASAEDDHPYRVPSGGQAQGARVEVTRLCKDYLHGGIRLNVLTDVDISLEPGDMVAVVGASGVGKSTLLQILGPLDLPTSGRIQCYG